MRRAVEIDREKRNYKGVSEEEARGLREAFLEGQRRGKGEVGLIVGFDGFGGLEYGF